ncbi:MAG TPA: substrate-binding domain-containing protein [Chitinophagaceae bacterium]|nr:substrate-binding domain-containing protein [Chitinophagaceae bacterium]
MKITHYSFARLFLWLILLVGCSPVVQAQDHRFDPPWNTPPKGGVNFTVAGIDNVPDLYGDINNPQLVIFFAGNQYMVIDELLQTFKKAYPQYERIFAETLPPGILMQQIKAGSLVMGNMRISLQPDIYTAGKPRFIKNLEDYSRTVAYMRNHLAIMVRQGNPLGIKSLQDLGRKDVRVSMPNPAWEGIGKKIEQAYVKAGGEALEKQIMGTKVKNGSTILTRIHHRQTPLNILNGQSDAGPVWISEVLYHQNIHHPVELVKIPDSQNVYVTYMAGALKTAPHPKAAEDFLTFLSGPVARSIYKKYGFQNP